MNNTVLYCEVQRFGKWWIWIAMAPVVYVILIEIVRSRFDIMVFWFGLLPMLLVMALIASIQLKTTITDAGVNVRLFPLINRTIFFSWEEMERVYVRQYAPIKEYGGWGLKGTAKNRAYNVSGKQGLQLELKDGKRVLIGTQRPGEIDIILKSINKYNA